MLNILLRKHQSTNIYDISVQKCKFNLINFTIIIQDLFQYNLAPNKYIQMVHPLHLCKLN